MAESTTSSVPVSAAAARQGWRRWLYGTRRESVALLLLSSLLLAALVWTAAGASIGKRLYDRLDLILGFAPNPDVVVVAIDEQSQRQLGGWPISRDHYARLIQRLVDQDQAPAALGIDLLFINDRPADEGLAAQMARLPVVLPVVRATPATAGDMGAADSRGQWQVIPSKLENAARAFGHIHVRYESDGILRGIQTQLWGRPHFSLALIEAAGLTGRGPWPAAEYLRFPMVDPARPFTSYRLADLLDPAKPLPPLKGKLVLLGVTDPLLGDHHSTIYSGASASGTPGVDILASAVNAHLSDRWVRVVPEAAVFLISLVVLLFALWSLQVLHPKQLRMMSLTASMALPLASMGALMVWGWWFDIAPLWLTLFLLALVWIWLRLEGNLRYLRRKSRELQGQGAHESVSGRGIQQFEQDLDWAIELQGRQLDLLNQMMEHLPEATAVIDSQDRLVQLNGRMQALGAAGMQQVDSLQDLLRELNLPAKGWNDLVSLASQTDISLRVPSLVDERDVYLKTSVFKAQGAEQLRLLMVVDVTELKRSQAQRDQALRFLSHDMRTPVASILALSRQMQAIEGVQPQCLTDIDRVIAHADQLMSLMDGFLFESMAHSEQLQLAQRLIDDLLDDAIAQVRDLASARAMRIEFRNGERYFFVQVATGLMVRVFMNLLLNAIKYGQPGTSIDILAEPAGDEAVSICICNQIAQAGIEVDENIATQGFGLGLNFVRTVVQRHQGQLNIDINRASGQARAHLTLPAVAEEG